MPKPYPSEFRDDVVRVARNREPGVTIEQIANDFGVHPMTLQKWLRRAEVDDGAKPGVTRSESCRAAGGAEADPAAGAGERGAAAGGGVSVAGEPAGKRLYPLVTELAADGVPVAVTCRVLKLARQPYYRWLANPITDERAGRGVSRERAVRRAPRRPRVRLPAPGRRGPRCRRGRWRTAPRGGSAVDNGWWSAFGKTQAGNGARSRARRCTTISCAARVHRRRPEPALAHRHHGTQDRGGQALPLRDQGRVLQPDRRILDRLDRMKSRLAVARAQQRRRPARRRRRLRGSHRQGQPISKPEVAAHV